MADLAALREAMVRDQIERRGIRNPAILSAFRAVPRDMFVPAEMAEHAYSDGPLPIGHGQTISQPYIVALMIQAADLKQGDRVLEVGAGSGFAAAVIGRIAATVIAIERHPALAAEARARLDVLRIDNVDIRPGDGTKGSPGDAPFDAILIAAAGEDVPTALIDQLGPGGRLVIPLGGQGAVQQLTRFKKSAGGSVSRQVLASVRFVPLIAGS